MRVEKSNFSFLAISATLWIAAPCFASGTDPICAGDRVYDSSYGSGRVVEVFADGTSKINFDRYSGYRFRNTASLGRGVTCQNNMCVGNRAYDSSYGSGTVEEVFSNGVAKLNFDRYSGYRFRDSASLGKGVSCDRGICVGNRVHDSSYGSGTVKEVFSNSVAKVDFDRYSGYRFRDLASLGGGTSCDSPRTCVGRLGQLDNLLSPSSSLDQSKIADRRDNAKVQTVVVSTEMSQAKETSAASAL